MNFQKTFSKYQFKNIGFVKLPTPYISLEQREKYGIKDEDSHTQILQKLCNEGFKQKLHSLEIKVENRRAYIDRVKEEIFILEELHFTDYALLIWSIIQKAQELGVFIDFGRGSCVSSCVFWLLGITGCDPVELKLFFSRFVNKSRAKSIIDDEGNLLLQNDLIADADINLGDGRDEIVAWLKEIYPNRIAKISTVGTYTSKIVLKDCYKVITECSEQEAQNIANFIEKRFGVLDELDETYKINPEFKKWADNNQDVYNIAIQLTSIVRQTGTHPSGWLIAQDDLMENSPLHLDGEKQTICSYTMEDVQAPKVDLLGLSTNQIIKDVLKNIPEKLKDMNLYDDKIIYDQFQYNGLLPYGLYQISAHCAHNVCMKLKPKNVIELSHVNAIARPGALAYEQPYVDDSAECPHELFRKALDWTKFLPLYQEQTIQMAMAIGFTADESEMLRRAIGKKKVDEIKTWKEKIYSKIKENNLPGNLGDILWKVADDSSSYSFNFCLSPDTIVETSAGFKMMFECRHGDKIKAFNTENKRDHFVEIEEIYKNKVELYEVELEDGRKIKASLNHKFLCEDNTMRCLEEIIKEKRKILTD